MSEHQRKRFYVLLALVVGVAVVLPVVFGRPRGIAGEGGDGWRNFIFDFQTLLTGILAIGAAWWNVAAMKAADASSDKRHKEVVEKARADEQRIIERAVNPQTIQLEMALRILLIHKRSILQINTLDGQMERISITITMVDYIVTRLLEITSQPQLREGMRLFDGETTYKIHALEKRVARAKKASNKVLKRREDDDFGFMKRPDAELNALYRFITHSETEIEEVLEGLKQTASRYGVEVVGVGHDE